jgi:hypothetical protein
LGVDLEVGDALYYRGMEVTHWREPLDDEYCYQSFFHAVDINGRHFDCAMEGLKRTREHGTHGELYVEP